MENIMRFCFRKRLVILAFALSLLGFVQAEEAEQDSTKAKKGVYYGYA